MRGQGLPTCIERVSLRLRDGRHVLALRINALQRPRLLRRLNQDGPISIEITLPRELRVRELSGRNHGAVTAIETTIDAFGAVFLEVEK